jgi:hypothetical protein
MTVGERIERIVMDMTELHKVTGLEYFLSQASGWAQWVWMLDDIKRKEWQLNYRGSANGVRLAVAGDDK